MRKKISSADSLAKALNEMSKVFKCSQTTLARRREDKLEIKLLKTENATLKAQLIDQEQLCKNICEF